MIEKKFSQKILILLKVLIYVTANIFFFIRTFQHKLLKFKLNFHFHNTKLVLEIKISLNTEKISFETIKKKILLPQKGKPLKESHQKKGNVLSTFCRCL